MLSVMIYTNFYYHYNLSGKIKVRVIFNKHLHGHGLNLNEKSILKIKDYKNIQKIHP